MKKYLPIILIYALYLIFLDILLFNVFNKNLLAAAIILSVFFTALPVILLFIAIKGSRFSLTLFSVFQLLSIPFFILITFLTPIQRSRYGSNPLISTLPQASKIVIATVITIVGIMLVRYFTKRLSRPYVANSTPKKEKTTKYLASVHLISVYVLLGFGSPLLLFAFMGALEALGLVATSTVSRFFTEDITIDNKTLQLMINIISQVVLLWLGIWASARFYVNKLFTTQNSHEVVTIATKYYVALVSLGIIVSAISLFTSTEQSQDQVVDLFIVIAQSIIGVGLFYFLSLKYIGNSIIGPLKK